MSTYRRLRERAVRGSRVAGNRIPTPPTQPSLKVVGEWTSPGFPGSTTSCGALEVRTTLVVVDLRELEFIDTSACLLLEGHRRVRSAGGRMLVVRGPAESSGSLPSSASSPRS